MLVLIQKDAAAILHQIEHHLEECSWEQAAQIAMTLSNLDLNPEHVRFLAYLSGQFNFCSSVPHKASSVTSAHLQLGRLAISIQSEVLKRLKSDRSDVAAPDVPSLCAMLSFVEAHHKSRDGSNCFVHLTEGLQKDFSAASLQVSIPLLLVIHLISLHKATCRLLAVLTCAIGCIWTGKASAHVSLMKADHSVDVISPSISAF